MSKQPLTQHEYPKALVLWTRRYAKSRTMSFLVQWVIIVLMVFLVGSAATVTNRAYAENNSLLYWGAVLSMGITILVLVWFSTSPWGGRIIWRVTSWLYRREGYVEYSDGRPVSTKRWWITLLGGGLVIHHLVGALLVSFNYLGLRHMQPFSAVYMVPFLMIMIYHQRLGFWAWIWPVLYAIHAILNILGYQILHFRGEWQLMNMVFPVLGYGLVSILAGHLYSRFALYKLKQLARIAPGESGQGDSELDPS